MNVCSMFQVLSRRGTGMAIRMNLSNGWRSQRGQTRVESAVALGALIIAGVGAWMLYKDSILETVQAMIGFFSSDESS